MTSKDFETFAAFLENVINNRGPEIDLFKIAGETGQTGLILEFGVAEGYTLNIINNSFDGKREVHGFDWFKGLPEDWRVNYLQGTFACEPPKVPDNVHLHIGLFQDTLEDFLTENPGQISLLHLDADLYSSTHFIMTHLENRLVEGSLVYFDELVYPSHDFREHEYKAFIEHHERTGNHYEYIGRRNAEAYGFRLIK